MPFFEDIYPWGCNGTVDKKLYRKLITRKQVSRCFYSQTLPIKKVYYFAVVPLRLYRVDRTTGESVLNART